MNQPNTFCLEVTKTADRCPIGEEIGTRNAQEDAIPVLSCEGACIRGEIARLAAHRLAKVDGFRRACHGELLTVPESTMATWVRAASEVVVIDGCHLACHARIIEHLVPREKIRRFNAASHHRKYCSVFEIDDVPEAERRATAQGVADWVQAQVKSRSAGKTNSATST